MGHVHRVHVQEVQTERGMRGVNHQSKILPLGWFKQVYLLLYKGRTLLISPTPL